MIARNLAITNEAKAELPHANVFGIRVEAVDMAAVARIEDALVTRKRVTFAWPASMELWRRNAFLLLNAPSPTPI